MKTIPLTRGLFAIVDDEDFEQINKHKWRAKKQPKSTTIYYAIRSVSGTHSGVYMHREILNNPKGTVTDHINHNGLDNRRENLRACTHRENSMNMRKHRDSFSCYKGVYRAKRGWIARIKHNGKQQNLGTFLSEQEAAKAYDNIAKIHFGKFAHLNFP